MDEIVVGPDGIRDALGEIVQDFVDEVRLSGVESKCPECGAEIVVTEGDFTCPSCGATFPVKFDGV